MGRVHEEKPFLNMVYQKYARSVDVGFLRYLGAPAEPKVAIRIETKKKHVHTYTQTIHHSKRKAGRDV